MNQRDTWARAAERSMAVVGLVFSITVAVGLVADVRSFDRTSGGHVAPYTDYRGTPMDWSLLHTTSTGMVARGYVVDVLIDCTSGLIRFEAAGLSMPFRGFSVRALAIHKPREACRSRGFEPAF